MLIDRPSAVAKYKFNEKERPWAVLERLTPGCDFVSHFHNGSLLNADYP